MNSENIIDENTIKLIENTREGLLTQKISLTQGLTSLHYISILLDREEDREWAENELKGIFLPETIPIYRSKVYCTLRTQDASSEESKKIKDKHFFTGLRIGVSRIISFINSEANDLVLVGSIDDVNPINKEFGTTFKEGDILLVFPRGSVLDLAESINVESTKKIGVIEKIAKNKPISQSQKIVDYDQKKYSLFMEGMKNLKFNYTLC